MDAAAKLLERGMTVDEVLNLGRWKSLAVFLKFYHRIIGCCISVRLPRLGTWKNKQPNMKGFLGRTILTDRKTRPSPDKTTRVVFHDDGNPRKGMRKIKIPRKNVRLC